MFDEYGNPINTGGWTIYSQPNTGASFDDQLAAMFANTAGIAVGAPLDPDLLALQNLLQPQTSGIAVDANGYPITGIDILTGAPLPPRPRMQMPQMQQMQRAQQTQQVQQLANLARNQAAQLAQFKANQPPPGFGQRAAVINAEPTITGLSPLPMSQQTPVAAGGSAIIICEPQEPFKPQRLLIVGNGWLITDFKVGNKSQFSASGIIPGEAFANNSTGVGINGDTADVGNKMFLSVINDTGAPRPFYGAVFGTFARSR